MEEALLKAAADAHPVKGLGFNEGMDFNQKLHEGLGFVQVTIA